MCDLFLIFFFDFNGSTRYNNNKNRFIDSALNFICTEINQDTVFSLLEFNFQDVGKYSFYKSGDMYDGSTTDYICSFIWEIGKPLQIKFRNDEYSLGEYINFPCKLNTKYEEIINK